MLKNKIALITGATRGIGRATAYSFAKEGATLFLNGRDESVLLELQHELRQNYAIQVYILPYDVTDNKAVRAAFMEIKKQSGRLDIVVNNAGIMEEGLLGMISEQAIKTSFSINVDAVIYHMQYAARLMLPQKSGSIINVSSIIGLHGAAGQLVYSASKSAIIGATYSAAKELGHAHIRVNAIAPGIINTDLTNEYREGKSNKAMPNIKMNRLGKPEEVANTILFLASDLSSYVTGQVIGVDGGMII